MGASRHLEIAKTRDRYPAGHGPALSATFHHGAKGGQIRDANRGVDAWRPFEQPANGRAAAAA
jgi:hypothetical protein